MAVISTAYNISEKSYDIYKKKVKEAIGEKKEQQIKDEVAKEQAKSNPMNDKNTVISANGGDTLVYDKTVGRYFRSNIETIRHAQEVLNFRMLTEMFISFNELYDELDLPHIEVGDDLGFSTDYPINIEKTWSEGPDGNPMLIIGYDHCPMYKSSNFGF